MTVWASDRKASVMNPTAATAPSKQTRHGPRDLNHGSHTAAAPRLALLPCHEPLGLLEPDARKRASPVSEPEGAPVQQCIGATRQNAETVLGVLRDIQHGVVTGELDDRKRSRPVREGTVRKRTGSRQQLARRSTSPSHITASTRRHSQTRPSLTHQPSPRSRPPTGTVTPEEPHPTHLPTLSCGFGLRVRTR